MVIISDSQCRVPVSNHLVVVSNVGQAYSLNIAPVHSAVWEPSCRQLWIYVYEVFMQWLWRGWMLLTTAYLTIIRIYLSFNWNTVRHNVQIQSLAMSAYTESNVWSWLVMIFFFIISGSNYNYLNILLFFNKMWFSGLYFKNKYRSCRSKHSRAEVNY